MIHKDRLACDARSPWRKVRYGALAGCLLLTVLVAVLLIVTDLARAQARRQASSATPVIAALDTMMREWVQQQGVPSASVAVMSDAGHISTLRYGQADANQPGRIASLSKAITAVCIVRLVEEGRVAFNTPIGNVLAATFGRFGEPLDPRFKSITIEQLLTHRAGLAREATRRRRSGSMASAFSNALLTPLAADPGGAMSYSNIGYLTLGVIIEAVTNEAYEAYCKRTTLAPMGAASAYIDPELRHRAPNGGWRISAVDYLKFIQVFDPKWGMLRPASLQWMQAQRQYGLGARMRPSQHGVRFYHGGRVASADRGGSYFFKFENGWSVVVIYEGDIERKGRVALPRGLARVFTGPDNQMPRTAED